MIREQLSGIDRVEDGQKKLILDLLAHWDARREGILVGGVYVLAVGSIFYVAFSGDPSSPLAIICCLTAIVWSKYIKRI